MRATVSMVPSLGLDTAEYATRVPFSSARANTLLFTSSNFLISAQIPRNSCERMTPELPRAPLSAPLETESHSSERRLEVQRFISFTADWMVSDIFVPVSPSGTGNTLSESTFALFISSTLAPAAISLRSSVPPMVFGMELLSPYTQKKDGASGCAPKS